MGRNTGKILIAAAVLGVAFVAGCAAKYDYELIATSSETTVETTEETVPDEFKPAYYYMPLGAVEVEGRQGVCANEDYYWVSSSRSLAKYDKDWNLLTINHDPFKDLRIPDPADLAAAESSTSGSTSAETSSESTSAGNTQSGNPQSGNTQAGNATVSPSATPTPAIEYNHIGDLDVYDNELYICAECFRDGVGANITLAVFDTDTLELKRKLNFQRSSGQLECSGIAVDPDTKTIWTCSWADNESSKYLYKYNLETGEYAGKVLMMNAPKWIQGITYYNGALYLTSDDGDAEYNEPDHLFRVEINPGATECEVTPERTFVDVVRQGEIEGVTFDRSKGQLLLLYNRGCRFVNGVHEGYYEGYDHEIKEIYVFMVSAA